MKHRIYFNILFIFSMLIFSACKSETISGVSSQIAASKVISDAESTSCLAEELSIPSAKLISKEEALKIAKDKINPTSRIIEVDHAACDHGTYYYILREYAVPDIPSEVHTESLVYQGSFTVGWYRINRMTKQLYKRDMAAEEKWDLIE